MQLKLVSQWIFIVFMFPTLYFEINISLTIVTQRTFLLDLLWLGIPLPVLFGYARALWCSFDLGELIYSFVYYFLQVLTLAPTLTPLHWSAPVHGPPSGGIVFPCS